MFKPYDLMMTDLLIFSVLQPYQVVSHTQQRDDEVDQSQDAVEPQKAVPMRHKNSVVVWTNIEVQFFMVLCYFMKFNVIQTYFALTLASVVLPKFSGLSPVEIMKHDREGDILIFWLKRNPSSFVWRLQWSNVTIQRKCFPSNLMTSLSSQWNFHTKFKHRSNA